MWVQKQLQAREWERSCISDGLCFCSSSDVLLNYVHHSADACLSNRIDNIDCETSPQHVILVTCQQRAFWGVQGHTQEHCSAWQWAPNGMHSTVVNASR